MDKGISSVQKGVHKQGKSKFTPEDDTRLIYFVNRLGLNKWFEVSICMGNKTTRQCRERWKTYLSPTISHQDWTEEEDKLLYSKYLEVGRKWSLIAKNFPNRTDTAVKNRFMVLNRRQKKNFRNAYRNEFSSGTEQSSSAEVTSPKEEVPLFDIDEKMLEHCFFDDSSIFIEEFTLKNAINME
jgi:hypothetical protein